MADPLIPVFPPINPISDVPPIDIGVQGNNLRQRIIERMRNAIRGTEPTKHKTFEEQQRLNDEKILSMGRASLYDEPRIVYPGVPVTNAPGDRIIDISILNLDSLENHPLQYVPRELDYEPNAEWVSLRGMARNVPLYHYTGGEDILEFEIDWHAKEENREDVLRRCKEIEKLSRNNGYNEPPPRVKFLWSNTMFRDAIWVVKSAKYRLSNFHKVHNYLPQQAYQKVVLVRVSETNPTWADVLNINR